MPKHAICSCGVLLLVAHIVGAETPGTDNRPLWQPFRQVSRPSVPRVSDSESIGNPIDAFVAAGHAANGLRPRPEAPRHVLLRRVYLDLVGLVPTPQQLAAFLADPAPNAYDKVVDQLLASPAYGERWGRH